MDGSIIFLRMCHQFTLQKNLFLSQDSLGWPMLVCCSIKKKNKIFVLTPLMNGLFSFLFLHTSLSSSQGINYQWFYNWPECCTSFINICQAHCSLMPQTCTSVKPWIPTYKNWKMGMKFTFTDMKPYHWQSKASGSDIQKPI